MRTATLCNGRLLPVGAALSPQKTAACIADETVSASLTGAVRALNMSLGVPAGVSEHAARRCGEGAWVPPAHHDHGDEVVDHPGDREDHSDDTPAQEGDDAHTDEPTDDPTDTATPPPAADSKKGAKNLGTGETAAQLAARVVASVDELTEPMRAALNGYTGYTLVTAGNEPFFDRMSNLIGSAHFWAPEMPV